MLKRLAATVATLAGLSSAAHAELTFIQWAKGPPDGRAIYVAGVLETVGVYAELFGYADELEKCWADLQMPYGEFDTRVTEFAVAHKDASIMTGPAPAAMMIYLGTLCPEARAFGKQ